MALMFSDRDHVFIYDDTSDQAIEGLPSFESEDHALHFMQFVIMGRGISITKLSIKELTYWYFRWRHKFVDDSGEIDLRSLAPK